MFEKYVNSHRDLVTAIAGLMIFLCVYCLGFAFFRLNKQIVHSITYTYSVDGIRVYSSHYVSGGDAPMVGAAINAAIAEIYSPACSVEVTAWQAFAPIGSNLSPRHLAASNQL